MRLLIVSLLAGSIAMPAYAKKAKPAEEEQGPPKVSVFVQCDGAKGHADGFELFGQLVAITFTAGLSEAAMGHPKVTDRLDGRPGAEACEAAVAQEGNLVRRTQLSFARTIHYLEAEDLDAALESARKSAGIVDANREDWAYLQSMGASAYFLEAYVLAKMGRVEEAEAVAYRSGMMAPYDLLAMLRVSGFLGLTSQLTPEKTAYLDQFVRLFPHALKYRAELFAENRDYVRAAADLLAFRRAWHAFKPDDRQPSFSAQRAVYLIMAGDRAASLEVVEEAQSELDKLRADGDAANSMAVITLAEELLRFQAIVDKFQAGQKDEAAELLMTGGNWTAVNSAVVADLLEQIQRDLPEADRKGILKDAPDALRKKRLADNLANLTQTKGIEKLYDRVAAVAQRSAYTSNASAVWKAGDDPKFLLERQPKEDRIYEVVGMYPRYVGLAAGEALILHCALIARHRGSAGFVLFPSRNRLDIAGVQFIDSADQEFPRSAMFDPETVIGALSQHIPEPERVSRKNKR
ncbi:MAG: hypothetical protein AB7O49_08720 [Sphingomonadales bacterium]